MKENTVKCPVCGETVSKRGLFMHVWSTDDSEGRGHGRDGDVPDGLELNEVEVVGSEEIKMDYPDTQDLGDTEYFDTYTGRSYEGKRGIMVHLGQVKGEHNIPADVTDRFNAEDFPIVETDDDGNIIDVIQPGHKDLPPIEPYLPWFENSDIGYVRKKKLTEVIERSKATGQEIEPDDLEKLI